MRTKFLVGGIGAAVLVTAATLVRMSPAPGPEPGPAPPPRLSFQPGARQAYRLRIDSGLRFAASGAGGRRTIDQAVAGMLHLRVLESDAGEARVALQLEGASLTLDGRSSDELNRQLGQLFLVTFAADGAPRRFEFPAALSDDARTVLEESIRTFQVVVPPRGTGTSWTVDEEHASGRYRAVYRTTTDGRILKAKVGYVDAAVGAASAPSEMRMNVGRADATIRIDPGAAWLERMVDDEELTVSIGSGLFTASTLSAELARTPLPEAATPLDIDAAGASYRALSAALASQAPAPHTAPAPPRRADELRSLSELVRALDASGGRSAALLYELRDLLQRDPGAAARLLEMLQAGVADATAAALVNALGMAATEEAQAVLQAIIEDPGFGRMNRARAALSLGSASEPGVESLAALRSLADDPRAQSEGLADTAVLSLGIAGNTLRHAGADEYAGLRDDLVRRVEGAADGNAAATALLAVGNTHDPALADTVTARLADPSPSARSAAVHALGKLGGADPGELARRLAVEEHGAVRSELAATLNVLPAPSAAALALVDGALAREGDPRTRYELARLLGENLETYPAGRATLIVLSSRDPSKQVRTYAAHALWGRR